MEEAKPGHEEPQDPQHDGQQDDHDGRGTDPLVHRHERDSSAQDDQHHDDDGNGLDRHSRHYAHSATYSPEDDKIRIYPGHRLNKETEYAQVKAAGFGWAPQQGCFYAVWTPEREDVAIELCGDVDDETISLAERAEQRAERFEGYESNRRRDSAQAAAAVKAIADGIPFGQPILVGHHSEKHARRDQQRIESGMRRAVDQWKTADYWRGRAAGALSHADYKARPDVRARRIKTIEASIRKQEKNCKHAAAAIRVWTNLHDDATTTVRHKETGDPGTFHDRALFLSDQSIGIPFGAWFDLKDGKIDAPEAQRRALESSAAIAARCDRWLEHDRNRLEYERAMLGEAGGTVADQTKPEKDGAVRCWATRRGAWSWIVKVNRISVTVYDNWGNGGGNFTRTIPFDKLRAVMSAAAVDAARRAGDVVPTADGTGFILKTDHSTPPPTPAPDSDPIVSGPERAPDVDEIKAMEASLKAGVTTVSAPQLFPTPRELAAEVIARALIRDGDRVLEPEAGTGRLIDALDGLDVKITAIEIAYQLAERLTRAYPGVTVMRADFLETTPEQIGTFDRIVMNPPFTKAADVDHINHARRFLAPGGRLVAICADGPKQQKAFLETAHGYYPLPAGSFASEGTQVSTAIVVFDADPIAEVAIETANAIARSGEATDAPFALKSEITPRPSTQIGLFE